MGPKASLNGLETKKSLALASNQTTDPHLSIQQPVHHTNHTGQPKSITNILYFLLF
jgi:hypothetical protein